MSSEVRLLVDCHARLGEGPVWVGRENSLYWVDIHGRTIFRWRAGAVDRWTPPWRTTALFPALAGGFIATTEHGFARIDLDGGQFELIQDPESHLPANRFNDAKIDRYGRLWAGTMHEQVVAGQGTLYRLDADLACKTLDDDYAITNGPAFDRAGTIAYHNDTAAGLTYRFALDGAGEIIRRDVFLRHAEEGGSPDGMTVDAEGCLWIAFWDGWCLRRFSPDGELQQELPLPVQRPTSVTFGGEGLASLFVTSARQELDEAALARQPHAGGLFILQPGVVGLPERMFGEGG